MEKGFIDLSVLGFELVGFWDTCFFSQNSQHAGITVKDKEGNIKSLSYFELNKLTKEAKEEEQK